MIIKDMLDIASKFIKIKGKYLETKDYNLFRPFYNTIAKFVIVKSGRQIGKSTAEAVKQIVRAAIKSFSTALTLLPLQSQSQRFSRLYVDSILMSSDELKNRVSKKLIYTAHLKQLTNGSELHYSYVSDSPDRIRGISVRDVYWDEIQDIIIDHIPIAEQCASHYPDSRFSYCGTPKTLDNTLEGLWRMSSQHEPFIICSRCRFKNYCVIPDVYKMLQTAGLSCQKCGGILSLDDVYGAQYESLNPSKIGLIEGYHIPQIYVAFNLVPERWKQIMLDYTKLSPFQFATEVLGISYDTGGRPITHEKLASCCTNRKNGAMLNGEFNIVVMGIDWGYGTTRSYTVSCIIGIRNDGKSEVIFAKKYPYRDRLEQIQEFKSMFYSYGCTAVGCDAGVGLTDNIILRNHFGADKVFEYNYCSPRKMIQFNPDVMNFSTNRTKTLSLLFNDLNMGNIYFFNREESEPFFDDILSVYEEPRSTPYGENKVYRHNHSIPDDFIHTLNFAQLTLKLLTKESILDSIIVSETDHNVK